MNLPLNANFKILQGKLRRSLQIDSTVDQFSVDLVLSCMLRPCNEASYSFNCRLQPICTASAPKHIREHPPLLLKLPVFLRWPWKPSMRERYLLMLRVVYLFNMLPPQPPAYVEGYPALDSINIEAQFTVRCQAPFLVDHERRWLGVQSPFWLRSS